MVDLDGAVGKMSTVVAVQLNCGRIRNREGGERWVAVYAGVGKSGRYWVPDELAVWVLTVTPESSRWK